MEFKSFLINHLKNYFLRLVDVLVRCLCYSFILYSFSLYQKQRINVPVGGYNKVIKNIS